MKGKCVTYPFNLEPINGEEVIAIVTNPPSPLNQYFANYIPRVLAMTYWKHHRRIHMFH